MSVEKILFLIIAAITLAASLAVVTTRKLIHAALWLVLALFGVAILYALLEVGFFAVVQVVIYIGAIAILFIFVAMLTRRVMHDTGPQTNSYWWLALPLCAALFGGLVWLFSQWDGFGTQLTALSTEAKTNMIGNLGKALVDTNQYVLPFELASVLLVAALIGALVIAWDNK